ncbi:hypothetical protein [Phytoactinopolyspora halotolerans]|uniref:Rpn family recombination-promoting nuclease/putative transposase n=1 Tax=Phytoactinopolyspora halotolerans TaxID=1981512 RepID=A0A6L9SC26_9ACTN|nr:hypothetical protein [Phytoactinopolyspora halotolerans]NEE02796.1 hypothetical protein [Phytoactinopolyspora halotolerans]
MPSMLHEGLAEVFRQRPALVADLLAGPLGADVPDHDGVRVEPGDLTTVEPTELRADAVVTLTSASGDGAAEAVLGVVVEVQLGRDKREKRLKWPAYVANLRVRLRCPVALLVVCVDMATARWCAEPIEVGPGCVLRPHVLGPDSVPFVTDVALAREKPELAVLSAMAHGADTAHRGVLNAVVAALDSLDELHPLYPDLVLAVLPEAARRYLEELMAFDTYQPKSEFLRRWRDQGLSEGRAEGRARSVLEVLDARGIEVPQHVRTRILECTDENELDRWLRRAATAASADELV